MEKSSSWNGAAVYSARDLVFRLGTGCLRPLQSFERIPFTSSAAAAVSASHRGMEDPARVSVIRARRPPMQVDEEQEEDDEDEEREEEREEKVECPICGEVTSDQLHYGGLACPSCKAFFRRTVAIHRLPLHLDNLHAFSYFIDSKRLLYISQDSETVL